MEQTQAKLIKPFKDISNWKGITEYYDNFGHKWRIEKNAGDFGASFRSFNGEQWILEGHMRLRSLPKKPERIKAAHYDFQDILYQELL